jgi:ABC-type hemin transport system ATPase subunit
MLTRLRVRNFKLFEDVEIELGNPVVFIGPNNSGKTSALQALTLWEVGLKRWLEKRSGKATPKKRPGITINRRDVLATPVPAANLLWRDVHTRDVSRTNGKQNTKNIFIEITVEGVTNEKSWSYGLGFDYANPESFYCKPIGDSAGEEVPKGAEDIRLAYLPPMSGLSANETRIDRGAINVRLGEGRTAEVLRNLCYQIVEKKDGGWERIRGQIKKFFGIELEKPVYIQERGEIAMSYRDSRGVGLDLSSSGRGLQQTLLLLAHLAANPGSVHLLDEPDAHLEALRQRQTYELLAEAALESSSQIIAASHSEIVLNEAADRDVVIAFVGRPHRIDDRGSQVMKALREIGFDHYYQAEVRGWILFLEGSSDLAILQAFAHALKHEAAEVLDRPYVEYVGNNRQRAINHFHGLREAKEDLEGIAIFDRGSALQPMPGLSMYQWRRYEIENYLCSRETLLAWAGAPREGGPLFASAWVRIMKETIATLEQSLANLSRPSPWSADLKVSDDFLTPLFKAFFKNVDSYNTMDKSNFHVLAPYVPPDQIDVEVKDVLDRILAVARSAKPATGGAR